MIGYLAGEVRYSEMGKIILFTSGVGFNVFVPDNLDILLGDKLDLYIHTHLREDNISLFGFKDPDELSLFEQLISVSGVGPKSALAIFSASTVQNITSAITQGNLAFFTSVPGIGKKSGQKIILELKTKIGKGDVDLGKLEGNSDLVDSLLALGFQKTEIQKVIPEIDPVLPISQQVKTALKLLRQ